MNQKCYEVYCFHKNLKLNYRSQSSIHKRLAKNTISMAKRISNGSKLKERCEILEHIIESISETYRDNKTTSDQKAFIETIIGAAIWYLPHTHKYWTGKISKAAKEALLLDKKARLTKEHQYPRKLAAKELLQATDRNVPILELYEDIYAKFNIVTPLENKKISQYQRDGIFIDIESAYQSAGIELLEITNEELVFLKKGI